MSPSRFPLVHTIPPPATSPVSKPEVDASSAGSSNATILERRSMRAMLAITNTFRGMVCYASLDIL